MTGKKNWFILFGRWLGRAFLALLALLMLSGFFAWLLFPRDVARQLPERVLNKALPQWRWQVASVRYEAPLTLLLGRVEALDARGACVFALDSLRLRGEPLFFLKKRGIRSAYEACLAGGAARGRLELHAGTVALEGCLTQVKVQNLAFPSRVLGREVNGLLSGKGQAEIGPGGLLRLQASLALEDGGMTLLHPVLGHELLPFTKITAEVAQDAGSGKIFLINNGVLSSSLGLGTFSGEIRAARNFAASALNLSASFQPLTAFFSPLNRAGGPEGPGGCSFHGAHPAFEARISGMLAAPYLALSCAGGSAPEEAK